MSKDKEKEASPAKPPSKVKKLLLIGTSVLALVGAGVGAGLYFGASLIGAEAKAVNHNPKLVLRSTEVAAEGGDKAPPREGTVEVPNDRIRADPKKYQVAYYPIPDAFTTNLADGSGFLQVGVSLSTYYDDQVIANFKRQSVPIRSGILMVLAEQDPAVLSTSSGKQLLQRRLTAVVNDVLREKEGFGGVDNVYFTNMVIQ
jgi:flagellar protein FliL